MSTEPAPPQFSGVAWFSDRNVTPGICQGCQRAAPTYRGYNGGQFMAVLACRPCISRWGASRGSQR